MNCTTICLLTSYIRFMVQPDTMSCNYCVDSRSSVPDCYDNILECAYRDPASLFICLNIYENAGSLIHHMSRCVSYDQFYVSDKDILKLNNGMCKYSDVEPCECIECPTMTTTQPSTTSTSTTTKLPITPRRISHHKHQHAHKNHSHKHNLIFHNGSIGTASAYRESQVAATSCSTLFLSLLTSLFCYLFNFCLH